MKTKILGIVTIVTLALVMLMTSVNAAEFTADKTEVSKGDIVTITVKTDTAVESMQFDIAYDATKFEYVADSATSSLVTGSNVISDGVVRVSALSITGDTTDTVTLQFKALENGEELPFSISGTEFGLGTSKVEQTFEITTVNVTVAEPAPVDPEEPGDVDEPTEPENPGDTDEQSTKPEQPTDTDEPTKPEDNNEQNGSKDAHNSGEYVDENGDTITRLPQTGSLVPAIAAGIAIIAVISVVVFKAIKK